MNDFFSIVVILGILFTFVPQYVRIIRKQTSLGLSPHFMLLGITSVIAQLVNIISMQVPLIIECRDNPNAINCFYNLLSTIQVAVLTCTIAVNCILFVSYYPKPFTSTEEGIQVVKCLVQFVIFICTSAMIVGVTAGIYGANSKNTFIMGQAFGVLCTILSCIQYIPQIYKTWSTKKVGALSAVSLGIQAPGSLLFAITIAMRQNTDVTSWASFLSSGLFQLTLFAMCLFLTKKYPELNMESLEEEDVYERNPLLV